MEKLKIAQVARELGITPAGVYKRLKTDIQLVENHLSKEKGVAFLTWEGVELLRGTIHKPVSINDSTSIQPVESAETTHLKAIIANQQRTIENLIFQSEKSRERTDTILMKLTNDISTLQKCLEYRKPEPLPPTIPTTPMKIVKPWEPVRVQPAPRPWYERLWLQMFAPETLREAIE